MSKWLTLAANLAPLILGAIPGLHAALIPAIVAGIQDAEALPSASGADKKAHVLGLVNDAVAGINASTSKTTLDPTTTLTTASAAIDTTVGVINLIHGAQTAPAAAA